MEGVEVAAAVDDDELVNSISLSPSFLVDSAPAATVVLEALAAARRPLLHHLHGLHISPNVVQS